MEALPDEVVVAIMGITGAGKSTLIRNVTGNMSVLVGHDLDSTTSDVHSYRFTHRGVKFVLVDTPGFNDSTHDDKIIMEKVLKWIESSYRAGTRLNGLIYLHRIIDPRMQGSSLRNMRMFRKLCGSECLENIVLATTFWEAISPEVGQLRERELRDTDDFWGRMAKKGSQIVRLNNDRISGLKILLEIAKKNKVTLQSQREMVNEGKAIGATAAAQTVNAELEKQKRELEEEVSRARQEIELEFYRKAHAKKACLQREKERIEKEAKEEEIRKAKQLAKWQVEFERKEREAGFERRRLRWVQEAQDRELARIEQAKEEEAARQQRQAEQARKKRQDFYRSVQCTRPVRKRVSCNKCGLLTSRTYYHCCHCREDNYFHCMPCGNRCPDGEHLQMKPIKYEGCIVM